MPLDIQRFVTHLGTNALPPYGQGVCARYVRQAIEAGGGNTAGHPINAKDWGPTLEQIGMKPVTVSSLADYQPVKGDVAVIQATTKSVPGHIQGFDGTQWISDFKQREFWPGPSYRNETPSFAIYRLPP